MAEERRIKDPSGAGIELPSDIPSADGRAVRASDADREQVVSRLGRACAEGRLTLEELSGRVGDAYRALYRGDLESLLGDLPSEAPVPGPVLAEPPRSRRRRWIVAVMGSVTRRGHWRLARSSTVVAVMGEVHLDLASAVIDSAEIELRLVAVMGELTVRVPEGVDVEVTGAVVMGERHVDLVPVRHRPGVPRLNLKVTGLLAEVRVTNG